MVIRKFKTTEKQLELVRQWRLKHPDYGKKWDEKHPNYKKNRYKNLVGWKLKPKLTLEEKKQKRTKYYIEWYKKNGRNRAENYYEAILEWRLNYPEVINAIHIVQHALRNKKIKKPKFCNKCNREVRLYAHHEDYNKPLKIIWVCGSCHKNIHLKKTNKRLDTLSN